MPRVCLSPTNFSFTEQRIRDLPPHGCDSASAQREYCDVDCVGLRVMVSKVGRKFWMFRYRWRGKKQMCWVGELSPVLILKAAHWRVWEMLAMISRGKNPADWKIRQRGILVVRPMTALKLQSLACPLPRSSTISLGVMLLIAGKLPRISRCWVS